MTMDTIGTIVNLACDGCDVVVSLITKTLSFSFNLSYFVGQLIVKLGVSLMYLLIDSIVTLRTLIQVLTEDYIVFLSDVGSSLSFVFKSLLNFADTLIQSLSNALISAGHGVQDVQNFIVFTAVSFLNFISTVLNNICYVLFLIRNSLVLVGSTAWDLCVFFPLIVISLKKDLVALTVLCMTNIRNAVHSFRTRLYHDFQKAVVFATDIPKESLYGLLVCIVLAFVSIKYHRSIRPLLIRSVFYILNQSQKTLMTAWTYLEAFTLWLLTNQMTPSLNGARQHVAGAEFPADDDNHSDEQNNEDDDEREGVQDDRIYHPERKKSQEQEDRLCVVCQDKDKCTIILPCRHVCLCYDCCVAIKRTHGLCPVCRHVIRRTMRVFI